MRVFFCILLTISLCYVHGARLAGAKYRKLALIADGRQRPDLVLAACQKGLAANPYNVSLHGYAAHALMDQKKYPEALKHLNITLNYYPNDLNALFNSAFANFYTGNLQKAFEMRDRIKKIKPSYIKQ